MADYTWFRLLVKAMGIILLAFAAPDLISYVSQIVGWLGQSSASGAGGGLGNWWLVYQSGYVIGLALQIGIALYLLFGGTWLVDRCLKSVYGRCPACDYDVRGVPATTCPECGIVLPGRNLPDRGPAVTSSQLKEPDQRAQA